MLKIFILWDNPQNKNIQLILYIMDFKTFLIENSNIKKSFINDFFEIIREDYFELSEEFLISSNKLQTWLNIIAPQEINPL